MAMKVHELAKEINLTSKELLERASAMNIDVKNHMSILSDADVEKLKGSSKRDNLIVKGKSTKGKEAPQEAPRTTVRATARPGLSSRPKPPIGKPIVDNTYLENKHKPPKGKPVGVPLPKAEPVREEASKPTDAVDNKSASDTEPKTTAKSEPKTSPDTEPKTTAKAEPKTTAKAEPKTTAKAEPAEPKSATKADAKHDAKGDVSKPKQSKGSDRDRKQSRDDRNGRGNRNDRNGRDDRNSRGDRNDRNGRDDRNGRNDRNNRNDGNNRGNGPRRDKPSASAASEKMESKPSRRDDSKKKHDYDKSKNKFDKFERKSLEKQTRKKHNKPKQAVVEQEIEETILPEGTIVLNVPITVAGFCEQTEVSTSKVIMTLMKLGIMANINQNIDEDTVMILAEDLGIDVAIGKVEEEEIDEGLELFEDDEKDLKTRPPIITVMGHVDHGKTSLLDAIRKTNVTASESGGITQHIGASEVRINGQKIVFLDTPGHEAFTAMRARGAHSTDIAVLVVAADDSVKPQTVESISHAKAAGVPIIVAINKMDKPGANPDKVKQDLTEHGILVEDWGGETISVPVSAKTGEGITNLLEMILLQAEMMELKANPNRLAMGTVIEARLDKSKGPVATLLVTNGTLQSGQSVVAGTCSGRIRLMTDFKGKTIKKAGPATAVEILGLTDVPEAGDEFNAVKEDKLAREIAEHRKEKLREEILARNASTTLEQLFSQIKEGEVKNLNLIIKGDVQGSVGALVSSLEKLNNENVKVNIVHTGVGTVTESDIMLAGTTGSIIIGFNVRPTTAVQTMADRENIQIRTYRVIYDVIDDVESAMKGMLDPEFKEEILGKIEIRTTFKVPGVGIIGGAYVVEGKAVRNAEIRLVRDGIVIHEGKISSLKRFKDDVKEVNTGYECGIGIEAYNDIKEGDIIECFHMVEIERK